MVLPERFLKKDLSRAHWAQSSYEGRVVPAR